jgi:arylesterase/monoxygenase
VAHELRAPLLVIGRGSTDAPRDLSADYSSLLSSTLPTHVFPSGLGRRATVPAHEAEVQIWVYERQDRAETLPTGALLWFHGGGYIGGTPAQDHLLCSRIARDLGVLVVSVDWLY